jgi:hypothetical protein
MIEHESRIIEIELMGKPFYLVFYGSYGPDLKIDTKSDLQYEVK